MIKTITDTVIDCRNLLQNTTTNLPEDLINELNRIFNIFDKSSSPSEELSNSSEYNLITKLYKLNVLLTRLTTEKKLNNIFLKSVDRMLPIINESIRLLSLNYFQNLYNLSTEAVENKLKSLDHYEKIINNDKELNKLYRNMRSKYKNKDLITKREYFFNDETKPNEDSFHIVFQINKNCNFKCTYCYEGLDKVTEILDIKDIPNIVLGLKIFQDQLKKTSTKYKFSFSILGGEPTILPKKLTHALTKELMDKLELTYIILITNNYSAEKTNNFFHPEFPKEKIKIQISYDGGKIQNDYRKDMSGKGTLLSGKREIIKLLEISDPKVRIALKATLPMEAIKDLKSVILDYVEFENLFNTHNNTRNFSYYPTFDTTSILMYNLRMESLSGNESQKQKLLSDIHESFSFLLDFELSRLSSGKKAFTRWFREISYTANKTQCSAGKSLFGLDQNGDGRYCHRTEFGETHTNIKFPYAKNQLNSLLYGNIKDLNFYKKFDKTKKILEHTETKNFSLCESCMTLTCVKCPMVNISPDRVLDTTTSSDLYKDMYSHGLTLSCEINNIISNYLFIFTQIVYNNGKKEKENYGN